MPGSNRPPRVAAALAALMVTALSLVAAGTPARASGESAANGTAGQLCPYRFVVATDVYVYDGNYYFRSYVGERILGTGTTDSTHRLAYRNGDAFWARHDYIQRAGGSCIA